MKQIGVHLIGKVLTASSETKITKLSTMVMSHCLKEKPLRLTRSINELIERCLHRKMDGWKDGTIDR